MASLNIRPVVPADLESMVDLLMNDAAARKAVDPILWKISTDAPDRIAAAVEPALRGEARMGQKWLAAMIDGRLVGLMHTAIVPVPPIYLGSFGAPGLIAADSCLADHAPKETLPELIAAAEQEFQKAGTQAIIAQALVDSPTSNIYAAAGYEPVTRYYSKSGFTPATVSGIRPATESDVPGIVRHSATHRAVLESLSKFWTRHPQADERFGNWMLKSLNLPDRDMLVSNGETGIDGYAIVQPATSLHFPTAHDISAVGHLDDFFHIDHMDPKELTNDGNAGQRLLRVAEAAFAQRGITSTLAVCPDSWMSKRHLFEAAGYDAAVLWSVKWL